MYIFDKFLGVADVAGWGHVLRAIGNVRLRVMGQTEVIQRLSVVSEGTWIDSLLPRTVSEGHLSQV